MLAAWTLGGCMTQRGIPAAGTVAESRVVTTVDTQLAKSYLETSFAEVPRLDQTWTSGGFRDIGCPPLRTSPEHQIRS